MRFGDLFGKRAYISNSDYEEGKKLFELGMICASKYKCSEALEYYSKSINAHKNPAPYINRANLLGKRVRHFEALQDLLEAKRLDQEQTNEFSSQIDDELAFAEAITHHYRNGTREKLIDDLKGSGETYVSERILCASFGISPSEWEYNHFDREMIEYHFFNEIDNIAKFDERRAYPDASEFIEAYPDAFIQKKLETCPDYPKYKQSEIVIHSLLCCYDDKTMQRLRNRIIYSIHSRLLTQDYGALYMSTSSDCEGVTREAADFLANQQ